eukprot:TRINITY_DN336_c6_g1_i1.p1 TRINITY_DN336_c6_g1~~TRINITY_DN336_c6_g1_i1.p1  ORF type:complete len:215 (+),score=56.67 TRINITY_DN336_c6_g1_i1:58-702(+)
MKVSDFLENNNFGEDVKYLLIEKNGYSDMEDLKILNDENFQGLGISKIGVRSKLIRLINKFQDEDNYAKLNDSDDKNNNNNNNNNDDDNKDETLQSPKKIVPLETMVSPIDPNKHIIKGSYFYKYYFNSKGKKTEINGEIINISKGDVVFYKGNIYTVKSCNSANNPKNPQIKIIKKIKFNNNVKDEVNPGVKNVILFPNDTHSEKLKEDNIYQ